ncbi:MAG: hypothetical protein EXR79_11290 [Myxococcales bacterium]|nr:hypothetical protein [Myxococcales bacterium]
MVLAVGVVACAGPEAPDAAAPAAVVPDCGCAAADTAVATDLAGAVLDAGRAPDAAPAALEATPTCSPAWLELAASPTALVPPPGEVTLTATVGGVDVSAACRWEVGPASVCQPGPVAGSVRRAGLGTCTAVCRLSGGKCGLATLRAVPQTVLYVVGGESPQFPPPSSAAAEAVRVQRFRTLDRQWDKAVAWLPEFRIQPVVAARGPWLYVLGGETGGDASTAEFWDVFFPTCAESIITPTQLKTEVGCRGVRRLDLRSGTWDTPFQWLHPRVDAGFAQDGDTLWVVGGQRAKTIVVPALPEVLHRIDLATGSVAPGAAPPPPGFEVNNPKLRWPRWDPIVRDGAPTVFAAHATWTLAPDGSAWLKDELGWPCPENQPRAVFAFPGHDDVFVLPSPQAEGPLCPQCPQPVARPDGTLAEVCAPWRLRDGKWTAAEPMPYVQPIAAHDGLYALASDGVYRLATPTGSWQRVGPPLPAERFGAAAVAVEQ